MRAVKRVLIAACTIAAIATTAMPSEARKHAPQPTPTPQLRLPPGYYIMQGNIVIGPRYGNVSDCYKALAALKNTLQPGTDTTACVHRQ